MPNYKINKVKGKPTPSQAPDKAYAMSFAFVAFILLAKGEGTIAILSATVAFRYGMKGLYQG